MCSEVWNDLKTMTIERREKMIVFLVILMSVILLMLTVGILKADDTERHDDAVRMWWEEARESEPPEWADPDKWWESER